MESPRFVLFSHHRFSTIVITSNMIQLSTRFDNNFSEDWSERCKPYLEKKVNLKLWVKVKEDWQDNRIN